MFRPSPVTEAPGVAVVGVLLPYNRLKVSDMYSWRKGSIRSRVHLDVPVRLRHGDLRRSAACRAHTDDRSYPRAISERVCRNRRLERFSTCSGKPEIRPLPNRILGDLRKRSGAASRGMNVRPRDQQQDMCSPSRSVTAVESRIVERRLTASGRP